MTRLVITASADADVADILNYLRDQAGQAFARKYADELDALYERLTDFPGSGPPRPTPG